MRVCKRVLLLCACAGCWSCEPEDKDIDLSITVEGESVTVSWDGRTVHEVHFFLKQSGVWGVGTAEDPSFAPRHDATILPPLRYGQDVENSFTLYGPEPLERGAPYEVQVIVLGWDAICEEHGIDVPDDGFDDPSSDCYIAFGRASFTF